jgi:hypothetical protein
MERFNWVFIMNLEKKKRRGAVVCIAVVLIMVVCFVQGCFAADESDASDAIREAEKDLNEAYVAVVEADAAGADVSNLSNELNSAGAYLSSANAAFDVGDYDGALVFATECINSVKGISGEAENLESYAKGVRSNTIFLAVFVSVFGVVSVVVLGFIGWELLKRRRFKEILDKKPVTVDSCEL